MRIKTLNKECVCMICDDVFLSSNSWAKVCSKDCYLEKQRINSKKHRLTDKYKIKANRRQKQWRKENLEKIRAQKKLQYAVKSGKVTRPDICEQCLIQCNPEGHHQDYKKPLEVVWLCSKCHKGAHLQCV